MASRICLAQVAELIIAPSSMEVSPLASPLLSRAAILMLEVVNPGHAVNTCTPESSNSVRKDSSYPLSANFEAEYPDLPGKPLKPAIEEMPTILPLFLMIW